MQAAIRPLIQYLVYPLVLKLSGWLYNKFVISQVNDEYEKREEKRQALMEAIKNAKDNEQRRKLSMVIVDYM